MKYYNIIFLLYLTDLIAMCNSYQNEFSPIEIHVNQLKDWNYMSRVLALDGIVAITGLDSSYTTSLSTFKQKYDSCKGDNNYSSIPSLTTSLHDGTNRVTVALKSHENFRFCHDPMINEMANKVRDTYTTIQSDFLLGIRDDDFLKKMIEVESLDHFHSYSKVTLKPSDETLAIDFHKDKGLFLLLTPSPGLLIRRISNNEIYTVTTNSSNILLLLGSGLSYLPVGEKINDLGRSACEHGVQMTSNQRFTIARMILPSKSFTEFWNYFHGSENYVQLDHKLNTNDNHETTWYNKTGKSAQTNSLRERNLVECAANQVYCWMQCQSTDCASAAICWDYTNHVTCPTSGMQPQCKLKCPDVVHANKTHHHFCTGSTSMFMEGFDVSYEHEETACVILFFSAWTLDTALKFSFGCIGVFLLGLFMEGLLVVRRRWSKYLSTLVDGNHWKYKIVSWLLVFLAIGVGYLCMLVAMTYSMELFLFVVAGLATGHIIGRNDFESSNESVEPCCAVTDDTSLKITNKTTKQLVEEEKVTPAAILL